MNVETQLRWFFSSRDVSTKWWNAVAKYPWIAVNKRLKFGEMQISNLLSSIWVKTWSDLRAFLASMVNSM